jgi:hypothetical protein
MSEIACYSKRILYLQFCHERLESVEEDASVRMGHRFSVQAFLQRAEECVELFGFDDWPWYDIDPPAMETGDEVGLLLPLDNLLELETEPGAHNERLDQNRQIQGGTRTLS